MGEFVPKIKNLYMGGLVLKIKNFYMGGLVPKIKNFYMGGLVLKIKNFYMGGFVPNGVVADTFFRKVLWHHLSFKKGGSNSRRS